MEKAKARPAAARGGWYVIQQHDHFEVVSAADRPATQVEKGERRKVVLGPFATKELAQAKADHGYGRTLAGRAAARGR